MKRKYWYLIVMLVLIGLAAYLLFGGSGSKEITYRTEAISRGAVQVQVRATGQINPVQTVQVGSQVSGILSRIFVDFNSKVKKGDVVAIIDSTFLYASVKESQANLERNQAQLNEAKRTYERTKGLFEKSLVSQADLDAAQTAYESAVAQLKQAQASLDRANVNLRYSVIRAPIDGVVISRDVDVGQTVAASLQAPKLFSIANDLTRMQVEASVDEADIGQIKEGQSASFTVDAYPEQQFRGTVTQVRLAPVTVQNVVTYTVIVDVPNPELKLRPGMTATISIMVSRRDDVLRIPVLALRFQPTDDAAIVSDESAPQGDGPTTGNRSRDDQSGGGQRGGDRKERRMDRRPDEHGATPQMRETSGDGNEPVRKQASKIWLLESGNKLRSVMVQLGLNDNRYAELLGSKLKEGDVLVIGQTGGDVAMTNAQTNPFQPRMMGPGGGGGGGGRMRP
jgi:HlyD family secretion protein